MNALKHLLKSVYWNVKLYNTPTPKSDTIGCILLYHGVVIKNPYRYNMRFITKQTLENHLHYFKRNANLVTVEDILNNNISKGKINIAISFDDGYKNNYTLAAPLLKKLAVPATFYITTTKLENQEIIWSDFLDIVTHYCNTAKTIDGIIFTKVKGEYRSKNITLKSYCKNSNWDFKLAMFKAFNNESKVLTEAQIRPYWELMSASEIQSLSNDNLFTIGSHGVLHNCLTDIQINDAIREMNNSKKYLSLCTNKEITQFAYPDGRFSNTLISEAAKLGYTHQLLVDSNPLPKIDNVRVANRLVVNPYLFGRQQFNAILNEGYH